MKKMMLMALLAVSFSAYAATDGLGLPGNVSDDKNGKNDLVLHEGDNDLVTMHLGVGVNVATDVPDGYSFAPFKSWDIQWTMLAYEWTPKNASQTYSVGIGLKWSNYGLKDKGMAFEKVDETTTLVPFPEGVSDRYSRVHTLSLNFPVLFKQDFGKHFSFTVGPVLNINTGAWLKSGYEVGDVDHDFTTKQIGQRKVTVDIFGALDIYGVEVFCRYAPMSVFKKDHGPEFKSLTFGLYF